MPHVFVESQKEGPVEDKPLVLSYASDIATRRVHMANLLLLEHRFNGCVENARNRHSILHISSDIRSALDVIRRYNPDVVITDSRFNGERRNFHGDAIARFIRYIPMNERTAKVFCLGMYGVELPDMQRAGVSNFMEEDEAFYNIFPHYDRKMVFNGIRTMLQGGSYRPVFPQPEESRQALIEYAIQCDLSALESKNPSAADLDSARE